MYKYLFCNRSFAQQIDLSGMHIDVALRKFQTHFRMPVGIIATNFLEYRLCSFNVFSSLFMLYMFLRSLLLTSVFYFIVETRNTKL